MPQCVIIVFEQGGDPKVEVELMRVMVELLQKDGVSDEARNRGRMLRVWGTGVLERGVGRWVYAESVSGFALNG